MHFLQQKILNLAQEADLSKLGLRKLGKQIGEEFPQKIKYHLGRLEENGFVKLNSKKSRIVKVLKKSKKDSGSRLFQLPILGRASCGPATIVAEECFQGYLPVSQSLLGGRVSAKNLFVVIADGESLNRAKKIEGGTIDPGDYVIVDTSQKDPESGEYVLSVIDGLANLKRFYKSDQDEAIKLVSESENDEVPIVLHRDDLASNNYQINGTILRVVKGEN